MDNELLNGISQCIFTKEDHSLQAAFLNTADESFREGIAESRRLQIVWEARGGGSEQFIPFIRSVVPRMSW